MSSPIQEFSKEEQVVYNVQRWLQHCAKEGAVGFQLVDIPEEIEELNKEDLGQPFKYIPKKEFCSLFICLMMLLFTLSLVHLKDHLGKMETHMVNAVGGVSHFQKLRRGHEILITYLRKENMASPIQELSKGQQVIYNVLEWLHHCAKEGAVGFQFVDIPDEMGGCSKKDIGQPFKYMPKKKLGSLFNLSDYAAVCNAVGSSESSFGED